MADTPRTLIAGNWKMNGLRADGLERARSLVMRMRAAPDTACAVLICPPATLVAAVAEAVAGSGVLTGAQDCHAEETGAFTGEISAAMIADAGASHVILGHSERRHGMGETDAVVRAKAAAALRAGLTPIVCVGETEAQRDAGKARDVVAGQLAGSLPDEAAAEALVIAYEPVWAIGTGRTPSRDDIADMHTFIRGALDGRITGPGAVPILYGGSANPDNAAAILAAAEVGGLLVGGASLDASKFWAMIELCR